MCIWRSTLCVAMVLFWAQACTTIDVKTDFDPSADFTRFHTFAFAGLTDITKTGLLDNSLTRKRIETGVSRELTKKGLQEVKMDERPDLLVHYWLGTKDKQRVQGTTSGPSGGYYGGYYGGGYGWGANYNTVTTYEYTEGTLVVDLVEPTKKELQWRATMVAIFAGYGSGKHRIGQQGDHQGVRELSTQKECAITAGREVTRFLCRRQC